MHSMKKSIKTFLNKKMKNTYLMKIKGTLECGSETAVFCYIINIFFRKGLKDHVTSKVQY